MNSALVWVSRMSSSQKGLWTTNTGINGGHKPTAASWVGGAHQRLAIHCTSFGLVKPNPKT